MNNQKKILVVEDDTLVLGAVKEKLLHSGFEVLVEKNGEAGLQTALAMHPDLILLDFMMPKMDGPTMLKALRGDNWGKLVPVMMFTNMMDFDKIKIVKDFEDIEYFIKSEVKIEEIIQKIKSKLN